MTRTKRKKTKPFMITISFPLPRLPRMSVAQRRQIVAMAEHVLTQLRATVR